MDPTRILKENLHLIQQTIDAICRRKNLHGEDASDFASEVKIRLCEDGYRRIRLFEGKSSFQTYIHTVVTRIYIDYIRTRVPRWRPSESATRLGPAGIKFEELLLRDNHDFDDAYRIVTINYQLPFEIEDAGRLAAQLRKGAGAGYREVASAEEVLLSIPSSSMPQDELVISRETNEKRKEVLAIMEKMQGRLTSEERLLLKMRFDDDIAVSVIARLLGRERSWVDRVIRKLLLDLRKEILATPGINEHVVIDILRFLEGDGETHAA